MHDISASAVRSDEIEEDPNDTWPPWSMDVFRGWKDYFRLGGSTAVSLFIESSSFEVNSAIAGKLGQIPLAAHSVLTNTAIIWYMTPAGTGSATAALIGNMLGADEPQRARRYAILGYVVGTLYGLFNGLIGLTYRYQLGQIFTSDSRVIEMVAMMMPVMWLYGFVDSIKCIGMSVLRGSGRPFLTVRGNILACLIVGYPFALTLVFFLHLGLPGLWIGMSIAWLVAGVIYFIVIYRTDWQSEAAIAAARNRQAMLSMKATHKIEDDTISSTEDALLSNEEEMKELLFVLTEGSDEQEPKEEKQDLVHHQETENIVQNCGT